MYNNSQVPPPPPPPKQKQKQKNLIHQITTIKRSKIANYPYYPVTHTLAKNGRSYIFSLDLVQQPALTITPFLQDKNHKQTIQYNNSYIEIQCLPRKNVNFLYILQYEDTHHNSMTGKNISVDLIDFVVGFSAGFLVRCKYTKKSFQTEQMDRRDAPNRRQLKIIGKFNKKVNHKQGMFAKMSSTFFGSDEFYKVAVQKPIRNFACHKQENKNLKYNYSYLVGNRLYFCTQFTQKLQQQTLSVFQQIAWQQMQMQTLAKLQKSASIAIKTKRHRTLKMPNTLLIEWSDQIPYYIYNSNNELIIADNEQNKIIIYNVLDDLRMKSIYNFDLDVKRMNYFTNRSLSGKQQIFLLIMPYDSSLYLLNLTNNTVVAITGHRSYITQSILTNSGCIITGGCDHRIGILPIKMIKQWNKIECVKGWDNPNATKFYQISTSKVTTKKLSQIYFIGVFNNVNEERNNNYEFGFGNFMPMGADSQLYAFITFDFIVKVYKANV